MADRSIFVVAYNQVFNTWEVRLVANREHAESDSNETRVRGSLMASETTREKAVRTGVEIARDHQPSQLLVKNKSNGRFSEERTYPRSSDPAETPG